MKPKIKVAWIKALKSGDYKQTSEQLRESGSFCCLGVLCNLHAIAHPEVAIKEEYPDSYLGEMAELPSAVMKWAGIDTHLGDYGYRGYDDDDYQSLASDNDSGKTFNEIADIINKHF